ncbi:hypothetical protein [Ectothiorhodospira lacustris]|uniref:hypothetical protein n=1 Tax=Ectothiorhodospira lacustris TaxID=2899127 RepID=UPI001EE99907|nr:hypothetical protein [Ectothiorhodospira lacustris]MCG5500986.1 hypothetical protein [Ectothiorhodospira lacustris]MCG5510014.1 hypothetical protein [Ectothiorhodospira lacustris]MCG5521760.1 hypothetical protein [Ectothiorhodospira lacustris]
MGIETNADTLRVSDILGVEDAETLLDWLLKHPGGPVNLAACTHLHAANLQVLMATRPHITTWPDDPMLADWLRHALNQEE